ncbi:hypothetical protein THTE_1369 [Thermogutta terrifontis]|uniref:Uncharacterized protein n=1 Tax=Thermogutta terrifontis TaxID=1331910 RepID=A0A286RDD4_9BACT|nr:hypothetical protein THTE_1369 [Thermogutta terrifontis]
MQVRTERSRIPGQVVAIGKPFTTIIKGFHAAHEGRGTVVGEGADHPKPAGRSDN